jgi:hypothetical protein
MSILTGKYDGMEWMALKVYTASALLDHATLLFKMIVSLVFLWTRLFSWFVGLETEAT